MTHHHHQDKRVIEPLINVAHNSDDTGLEIRVDLAGATKETVDLDMGEKGFCVKADAEDFRYENCFMLAHDVKPDAAQATFTSGLLKISVPFKESWHGHKVTIQ